MTNWVRSEVLLRVVLVLGPAVRVRMRLLIAVSARRLGGAEVGLLRCLGPWSWPETSLSVAGQSPRGPAPTWWVVQLNIIQVIEPHDSCPSLCGLDLSRQAPRKLNILLAKHGGGVFTSQCCHSSCQHRKHYRTTEYTDRNIDSYPIC